MQFEQCQPNKGGGAFRAAPRTCYGTEQCYLRLHGQHQPCMCNHKCYTPRHPAQTQHMPRGWRRLQWHGATEATNASVPRHTVHMH